MDPVESPVAAEEEAPAVFEEQAAPAQETSTADALT